MKDFVHLHVHSEYSLLDGYAATNAIASRAAELGMDSIALTDHGVMYGAVEFYEAARKAGIKPIIGVEAYMASGDHTTRGGQYYHLLLLAQNLTGYRNLVKLTTRAHLDGMYRKPRIDRTLLEQHSEGLIATSSCLAGEVNQFLSQGQKKQARETVDWYKQLFGPERYYLELQRHGNTPILEDINHELVRISKEMSVPLVATNDTHYVRREDLETHHHVLAMGYSMTKEELCSKNRNFDDSYYIMSGAEMWERFESYGTSALENTRRIADMCTLDLDFGRVQLPEFEIPAEHDAASFLRLVCEEGLTGRAPWNSGHASIETYIQRLDYELDVINQTGFPDYMLIVWDYVKFARNRKIPCVPRGSAGASLVLYCLSITDVDPVANKLLFERFLSPERLEMPDIDTDFADSRRHEVLEYIADKYGRENTAQIITYGTLGAKAAIRDMARVRGVSLSEADRVAKLIPSLPVGTTIAKALDRVPELRQLYDSDDTLRELIDQAQKVEGRMRNVGTHACGVVVSRNSLDEVVPLQYVAKKDRDKDAHAVMAAYEGPTLAKIGLLKMDILGLTNLSVVAKALEYIEQTTSQHLELNEIPTDDRRTFESLSNGETTNVFQFESAGMTRYMKELKPTRVEDLYAMVALYRPGPLEQIPVYIRNKNHPHLIEYLHPILEPILKDTYGVIVYQEQIMQLLQAIAGYTLGRAYIVLKAIGKKNRDLMAQEEPRFKEGCLKNGLTHEQANHLWDLIQPFAGYSFNRPHSTLYGLLSYQTAYLKNNYTAQYMAAVLDAAAGSIEDVAKAVTECVRLGVQVLPVHINYSGAGFTFERLPGGDDQPYAIRFGLSAIKNVGSGLVQGVIAARAAGGVFANLEDFCDRVDYHALNKRMVEALIKAGAFDEMPGSRRQKLEILDAALAAGSDAQKAREAGQTSMFDVLGGGGSSDVRVRAIPLPVINETRAMKKEDLEWEKELLGMYVSQHPVAQALDGIDMSGALTLGQITEGLIGKKQTFVGLIGHTREISTKKGDRMLVGTLEDLESSIEFVAFPRAFEEHKELLQNETVLRVTGKVDNRRDTVQLVIDSCEPVVPAEPAANPPPGLPAATTAATIADKPADDEPAPAPASPVEPTTPADSPAPPHIREVEGPVRTISMPKRVSVPRSSEPNGLPADNGHLNGNGTHSAANGNGNDHADQPPRSGRVLSLELPHTDNLDADIRRMQDIHELLRAAEGQDEIALYLPNGKGTVVLRPQYLAAATQQLLGVLADMLGEDAVWVD